jgi:hypothetical protein
MKKSIALFLFVFSLNINAQTFDETQLSGAWKVEEITGTLPMRIISFEKLILEEAMMVWDEEYDDWDWYPGLIKGLTENGRGHHSSGPKDEYLLDFFICNGNKLHLVVNDEYSLRFIIDELTNTTLILKTYKGDGMVKLTKDSTSNLRGVNQDGHSEPSTYSIQGHKVEKTRASGIYVQKGRKFISK